MIIFLYGADSYRSKQKLNEIVEHYKGSQKSGLNLIAIDADKTEFEEFYSGLKSSSMFAEKKLVIIKNLFSNKSFQEEFLEVLKIIQELKDVVVVYESESADQRLKLFKELTKQAKSQEFKMLEGKSLRDFVYKEFEKNNQKINGDALELLVSYVGNDLWRMNQEITKLSNYKKGNNIKKEDIELQIKPKIEVDIFKTIDAMAQKNKEQTYMFLKKHLDSGDNPLYLLSMIAYEFRNLLIVKELAEKGLMYASIVKKSGLHPFVVKKNYFMCQKFTLPELKDIYQKIFQIDSDIKVGKIEPETALDLLVSKV